MMPTLTNPAGFGPETHAMGNLAPGEVVSLKLTRPSGNPVGVLRVSSGCWCTAPSATDTEVYISYTAPGSMPEYYAAQGLRQCPLVQYITIYFTDDSSQTITLEGMLTLD